MPSIEAQHEWLLLGAREKAESVTSLAADLGINSVLEIGCGTGALLTVLDERDFATVYYAVEPSADLAEFFEARKPKRVERVDSSVLRGSSLRNRHYDLAILSHVIEHVRDPAALVVEACDLADYVILEVPIEGNFSGNLRAIVKGLLTQRPRHNNPAGHLHFFSRSDVRRLVEWSGCEIIRERLYLPHETTHGLRSSEPLRRAYASMIFVLERVLGATLWSRLYYGHFAVLIRRRSDIPSAERTLWPPFYYG